MAQFEQIVTMRRDLSAQTNKYIADARVPKTSWWYIQFSHNVERNTAVPYVHSLNYFYAEVAIIIDSARVLCLHFKDRAICRCTGGTAPLSPRDPAHPMRHADTVIVHVPSSGRLAPTIN